MANVSSSSSTSTTNNAFSSHGLSGFASGLDTESMVQAMLQSTQSKIDAQNQKITKLEWTQSIYRDVIKQVQAFQSKYFSFSNASTNLKTNSFWNTMKVASSNAAISVTNKSATTNSNMSISSVKQLATATTQYGKSGIVGDISLKLEENVSEYIKSGTPVNINVSLDGVSKTIELTGSTRQEVVENLNNSLAKAFGSAVSASLSNDGQLTLNAGDDHVVKLTASSTEAKSLLNMAGSTVSNKLVLNNSIGSLSFDETLSGTYFEFEINGTKITASASDTVNDIINRVNSSDAGVTMSYDTLNDCFVMKASSTGANVGVKLADGSYGISIKDTTGNLMNLLMGAESSNNVGTDSLKSVKTDLVGEETTFEKFDTAKSFVMTIDGKEVEFIVSGAETEEELVEKLNELIAKDYKDVSISMNELKDNSDQPTGNYEISLSGGNYEIELADAKDGSLNALLGFGEAKNYTKIEGSTTLANLYGVDVSGVDPDTKAENTYKLNISYVSGVDADGKDIITTKSVEYKASDSINTLITNINDQLPSGASAAFDEATGQISINAGTSKFEIKDADGSSLVKGLFGTDTVTMSGEKPATMGKIVQGQNAKLVVNNQEIERNSNSFELDGLQITLNNTYNVGYDVKDPANTSTEAAIELTSTKNTETIVTTIKEFVTAYNEMMKKVNDLLSESTKDLKKYPPLTEAQKKEMTEKEIELWEEKAKVGLLANDSLLTQMKSSFRNMLYSKVDGGLALYDIGITTNTDGTLKVDDNKLQAMVETEGARIAELFTDSEKGIAVQMDTLCTRYAKQSVASPGILVQRAGVKNSSTENQNFISRQIQDLQNYLKRLQSQYDDRKSRYWKQFTSLEKLVSSSNATSSYLSNMFTY